MPHSLSDFNVSISYQACEGILVSCLPNNQIVMICTKSLPHTQACHCFHTYPLASSPLQLFSHLVLKSIPNSMGKDVILFHSNVKSKSTSVFHKDQLLSCACFYIMQDLVHLLRFLHDIQPQNHVNIGPCERFDFQIFT